MNIYGLDTLSELNYELFEITPKIENINVLLQFNFFIVTCLV